MKPAFALASVVFAVLTIGCGGSVGGLLATVPPPVEFAGQRTSSLDELPAAGTYRGTLTAERVTYRYDAVPGQAQGEWKLVRSLPIAGSGDAEATVGAEGSITLRKTGGADLFTGTLQLSTVVGHPNPTTATLVDASGTSVTYPYVLRNGDVRTLTLKPHGEVRNEGETLVSFDQYWFELSPESSDPETFSPGVRLYSHAER